MSEYVITLDGGATPAVRDALADLPDARWVPSQFVPTKLHLEFPDSRAIWPNKFGIGVDSQLSEADHRAWADTVFAAVCAATSVNVELFDENDVSIRSRHSTSAA